MVAMDVVRPTVNSSEKPNHLHYLRDFRVEACPHFKQHQCQQHRPYTCFNWHFANQRRRRPVRRSDGTFNYSADVYCDKYDENTGICPDGDSCSFLHRVAGDVERKYHLRYYKTAMCVHPTDARGICAKNGPHCAFAHSVQDLRQAVHDAQESQNGTLLDPENRERTSFVVEDPLWHDQVHVLSCYKTEQCKKPARLCRQGYACPFYHNSKDRRRPPAVHKYRSTPCPTAKSADEWLEPEQCENGDDCGYCHTRTEQQFHPEIYKSTKCNDMLDHGYCPRAVFCAFAHHDSELHVQRAPYYRPSNNPDATVMLKQANSSTSSGNAEPAASPTSRPENHVVQTGTPVATPTYSAVLKQRQAPGKTVSSTAGDEGSQSNYPKAPGFERVQISPQRVTDSAIGRIRTSSLNMGQLDLGYSVTSANEALVSSLPTFSSLNAMSRSTSDAPMRVLPAAIDELSLDELSGNTLSPISEQKEHKFLPDFFTNPPMTSSSPMQIPNSNSPFGSPPLTSLGESLFQQNKLTIDLPSAAPQLKGLIGLSGSLGPDLLKTDLSMPQPEMSKEELQKELKRKSEELVAHHQKLTAWEEGLKQARQACEAWKKDAEYYRRVAEQAEIDKSKALYERDQALLQLDLLKRELRVNTAIRPPSPIDSLQNFSSLGSFNLFVPIETDVQNESGGPVCARCGREKKADSRNPSCRALKFVERHYESVPGQMDYNKFETANYIGF
ncbi:RING finger protein unkempt [Dirofilaria immitis]